MKDNEGIERWVRLDITERDICAKKREMRGWTKNKVGGSTRRWSIRRKALSYMTAFPSTFFPNLCNDRRKQKQWLVIGGLENVWDKQNEEDSLDQIKWLHLSCSLWGTYWVNYLYSSSILLSTSRGCTNRGSRMQNHMYPNRPITGPNSSPLVQSLNKSPEYEHAEWTQIKNVTFILSQLT